jgi:hypothetical protein
MNIYGLCLTRNEAGRYLKEFLEHNRPFFKSLMIYDERSIDNTRVIGISAGADVILHGDPKVAFANEGMLRQAAWDSMVYYYEPTEDDWIFVIDADEFLIGDLRKAIEVAEEADHDVINVTIPEVFDIDEDGASMLRVDGYWGDLKGARAAKFSGYKRYKPGMACGSLPEHYMSKAISLPPSEHVTLLHYGYARHDDRIAKHFRYSSLPGHSKTHIDSILQPPTLLRWPGDHPEVKL